jgi:hypothetical protein
MLGKPQLVLSCRCVSSLLTALPPSHPALLWTCGSVHGSVPGSARFTHTSSRRHDNIVSKFHHRSFHNVQHTLPSFRRPAGITLHDYVAVEDLEGRQVVIKSANSNSNAALGSKAAVKLQPLRGIHSEKNETKQRPFVLSPQGLVAASPQALQPYMRLVRLDRPIGMSFCFALLYRNYKAMFLLYSSNDICMPCHHCIL